MSTIFENNSKLEEHRVHDNFIDISFGCWCGVLTRKKLAAKLATIQKQYLMDVKDVLAENLDQLELSSWDLDYSTGKQKTITYYTPSTDNEKRRRVNILTESSLCRGTKKEDVFFFENRDEVNNAMVEDDKKTENP